MKRINDSTPAVGVRAIALLAAGNSSRMGTPKGLLDYHGRPWLTEQLSRIETILPFPPVILVLGDHLPQYLQKIPKLGQNRIILRNLNPTQGQFSSIQLAAKHAVAENLGDLFILPIDIPCPPGSVWEQLARAPLHTVAIPTFDGKRGHPVRLSRQFLKSISTLDLNAPSARLDHQIRALPPEDKAEVPVSAPEILLNLNTPELWNKFTQNPHPHV